MEIETDLNMAVGTGDAADIALGLGRLTDQARAYAEGSKAANTRRAYAFDWARFIGWCGERGLASLPARAETVALYATDLAATRKVSTINRRLSVISQAHQAAGFETPTKSAVVRAVLQGIKRSHGVAQAQKAPVVTEDIRAMVRAMPMDTLGGIRDRALLLTGFVGALRRSEVAALDVADAQFVPEGVTLIIRRSKSDQEGAGERVGLPYASDPLVCPVRGLRAWREASGITEGALFRPVDRFGRLGQGRLSGQAVAEAVKRAVGRIGRDPADYAGHSLRAGMATAAAQAGAGEAAIQRHGRWRSLVVRRYVRHGSLFVDNAAMKLGL